MTMKCPECGAEFVDGNEECTDCKTLLIPKEERSAGEEELITEGVDVEILTTVNDHLEAELLQGILANQGIPSYSQDEESGGYMRIYMGYSIFGEKIYVRSSDFPAAQQCLKEWEDGKKNGGVEVLEGEEEAAGDDTGENTGDFEDDSEGGGGNPLILKDRRTAAIIILAAAVILGFIAVFPPIP